MNTAVLERPTSYAPRLDGLRRRELLALFRKLELWLPAEERRLAQARRQRRPQPRSEADWRDLLRLYERLCLALAPQAGAIR